MTAADDLVARVGALAKGAEVIASVREGRAQNVRFAAGDITTSGSAETDSVSLTVAIGKRHAMARTNQTSPDALDALAMRAVEMAKLAPDDPEWMPVMGPSKTIPAAREPDPSTLARSPESLAAAARAAIELGAASGVTTAGFVSSRGHTRSLATSAGFSASYGWSGASYTVTARTSDGTGSGWGAADETRAADLDAKTATRVAIDKANKSRAPTALEPGRYDVVLEPAAVGTLIGFLLDGMDARAADEGRSFFSRKDKSAVGEALFSKDVTLRSDPHDPRMPGATFDSEGVTIAATDWIREGTLATLRASRYWAEKKGTRATGEHDTLELSGGRAEGASELVKGITRGLLVTRFWYCRWLDRKELMVTGLTRDGVFLVENGAITRPVNNFRFNDSPARMLANVLGMTASTVRVPEWDGVVRMPAVAARAFNMASVSAAV